VKGALLLAAALAAACPAGERGLTAGDLVLPPVATGHLDTALQCLDMDRGDLGFFKAAAESRLVPPAARAALDEPLSLCRVAETALRDSALGLRAPWWDHVSAWMGIPDEGRPPAPPPPTPLRGAPPALRRPLEVWVSEAARCRSEVAEALAGLDAAEQTYVAAALVAFVCGAPEEEEARRAFETAGVPTGVIARVVSESQQLDGRETTRALLDRVERVRAGRLLSAGRRLADALAALRSSVRNVRHWPRRPVEIHTPHGVVRIGTPGDDAHRGAALLILDPGGNDVYEAPAGAAEGLLGRPVAAILDLGGDDRYLSSRLCGPGTGLLGVSAVLDAGGDDDWSLRHAGCGAGLVGCGLVADQDGNDRYAAGLFAQGAGLLGLGRLADDGGNDSYRSAGFAQGFAGTRGVGWLVDRTGNDTYFAGGEHPDFGRHEDQFMSMAQGCALGMRPAAGGGLGVLADLEGNDTYTASVYGQGVSYWYSVGLLLDLDGQDVYSVHEYGQGSGIHLSAGLLFDGAGNDRYSGFSLAQGSAHDYGVGFLMDRDGHDTYTADHYSQGRGINNGFGLLCDAAGDDAYFARRSADCQGIGHLNDDRGSASLSLLLDLAGKDQYSSGAADGACVLHPWTGVLYDVPDEKR
jgi:hypothetical protein